MCCEELCNRKGGFIMTLEEAIEILEPYVPDSDYKEDDENQ